MCGFAAVFAYGASAPPVSAAVLAPASAALAHRGPDGAGDWVAANGRVGLAHRRLAIIDPGPAAAQPMQLGDTDGDQVLVFNGEIYNFRELKAELEAAGAVFRTQSDTEVVLHLYRRHGEAAVERLSGMFAFALWDGRRQTLLLARDALGIKPLYYADDGRSLRCASEVRGVRALHPVSPDKPDAAGHAGFFLLGSVPEPHTLYAGISALPAGATLTVGPDGIRSLRRWFDVPALLAETEDVRLQPETAPALAASVARHLVADVPLGVFLSAGVDSAAVLALAAESGAATEGLTALTLGFDELEGTPADETAAAGLFARQLSIPHVVDWIGARHFAEAHRHILQAMDQPSVDGVNSYFVARLARQAGLKVALSGVGGDELFQGYDVFQNVPAMVRSIGRVPAARLIGGLARRVLHPVLSGPLGGRVSPKAAGVLELGGSYAGAWLLRRGLFMPWELGALMDPEFAAEGVAQLDLMRRLNDTQGPLRAPGRKIAALEMCWYLRNQLLRDADWAGMAHGVEIRTPLVDGALLRTLAPALGRAHGPTKAALAAAPKRPLPDAILQRPKTGFGIPVADWLQAAPGAPAAGGRVRGLRGWAGLVHGACWQGSALA